MTKTATQEGRIKERTKGEIKINQVIVPGKISKNLLPLKLGA